MGTGGNADVPAGWRRAEDRAPGVEDRNPRPAKVGKSS